MSWNWNVFRKSLLFVFLGFLIGIMSTIDVDLSKFDGLSIFTGILVVITIWYAYSTHRILAEQRKSKKIEYIEKRLENLYLLRHNLRCRKIFWVIGDNNRYQLNTDKIKFQFRYLFSQNLKDKIELLIRKLVAADNEKEPKMMPWELPYVKSTTNKTLEILEKDIEICENDLNDLVEYIFVCTHMSLK